MESYYIVIVAVLFILAISDLIVGVSNDAVNFLNSAIGSKAAPFTYILIVAAAGVLVGSVFSSGMMEVARKGIFNPDQYAFSEIMVVFLAVMMTDILLLDFFNSVGLPTSTTVSIVFELLGASISVALFKTIKAGESLAIGTFINSDSAILIVAGIFLSIFIAFNVGLIIMALVRFAFSYRIMQSYKYWGGIWGGFAITAIMYFLLIKGAKGSTLITDETNIFLKEHINKILLFSFIGWTFILQIFVLFTRVNILKFTVLIGTFALAMAFAGNDLVNFIGVPLAGLASFKAFIAAGMPADDFMMTALSKSVQTPTILLLAAGLVMVITLRLSKKARSVTATTIDLSRQSEGSERFASTGLARFLVRKTIEISNLFSRIVPRTVKNFTLKRFDSSGTDEEYKTQKIAFDLVRASVNLVVASILISIGTSLKLPLSTTYVTFMVAMGTSLADGAWGRESAVYRITGVLTVIGGWFLTALIAFTVSFIVAALVFFGKLPVIAILILASIYIMIKTHAFHKKRTDKSLEAEKEKSDETLEIIMKCENQVKSMLIEISKLHFLAFDNFAKGKLKELKSIRKQVKKLNKAIKSIKDGIPDTLKIFRDQEIESGHYYVQLIDYLKEASNALLHTVQPAYNHLDNNHALETSQSNELKQFNDNVNEFFNFSLTLLQNRNMINLDEFIKRRDELIDNINEIIKKRIKSLKKKKKGTKVSMTYIEMLTETKNMIIHVTHLVKTDADMFSSLKEIDSLQIEPGKLKPKG